jgi:hypothetical protein
MTKEETIYRTTITELNLMINTKYGSIKNFSQEKNFEYKHLCKVLNGKLTISLKYFCRLCLSLNIVAYQFHILK